MVYVQKKLSVNYLQDIYIYTWLTSTFNQSLLRTHLNLWKCSIKDCRDVSSLPPYCYSLLDERSLLVSAASGLSPDECCWHVAHHCPNFFFSSLEPSAAAWPWWPGSCPPRWRPTWLSCPDRQPGTPKTPGLPRRTAYCLFLWLKETLTRLRVSRDSVWAFWRRALVALPPLSAGSSLPPGDRRERGLCSWSCLPAKRSGALCGGRTATLKLKHKPIIRVYNLQTQWSI